MKKTNPSTRKTKKIVLPIFLGCSSWIALAYPSPCYGQALQTHEEISIPPNTPTEEENFDLADPYNAETYIKRYPNLTPKQKKELKHFIEVETQDSYQPEERHPLSLFEDNTYFSNSAANATV